MKYKLTDVSIKVLGKKLFQIEALASFLDVKKGEKGGFIEKEGNLSQDGDAWVSGNAQVFGDARVSGDAWVSGNAQVFGDARVSGNAQVSGNAWVSGDARVSGNAWVFGDAQVFGNARVSGNAQVYGDARVSGNAQVSGDARVSPINITSLQYNVTILDTHIQIGCMYFSAEEWEGFYDKKIDGMDKGKSLKWWKAHKDLILGLYKANRTNGEVL